MDEMEMLGGHLANRYGVKVDGLIQLDDHVYRIDGPAWIARSFPRGAEDAAMATAELLRALGSTPFPAERLADAEPVSMSGDRPVLVTHFVVGKRAPSTPRVLAALGALLGALHARSGQSLRPGGGWHHLVPQGTPRDEIDAAVALVAGADGDPGARRALLDELAQLDDCADLPHGVVHPDFVPMNVLYSRDHGAVVIDWAGSGRGPRLWSLGFLLWAAGNRDLYLVDPVVGRYRDHVQLSEDELERLDGAVRARSLTMGCWSAAHGRTEWAHVLRRLDLDKELAARIGDRARQALVL
jgi:Ser/Thr protein kinase RdoA (MazF antagonist)